MAPSLAPAAERAPGRIGVGERARVRHGQASRADHRPHRGGPPPRRIAHAASPQPAAQATAPGTPSIVIHGVVQHFARLIAILAPTATAISILLLTPNAAA